MHKKKKFKLTKKEFQLLFAVVIFIVVFILSFIKNFFSNCIFEWPPRWDVVTCWHEQVAPSRWNAAEKAANFVP